jgi:hypothetical protein
MKKVPSACSFRRKSHVCQAIPSSYILVVTQDEKNQEGSI